MNRRGFLKALLAAPAAGLVPWRKLIGHASAYNPDGFVFACEDIPLDAYAARYLEPVIAGMAQRIDEDIFRICQGVDPVPWDHKEIPYVRQVRPVTIHWPTA